MRFALSEEQELVRDIAYKLGQQQIVPDIAELDREHRSDQFFR